MRSVLVVLLVFVVGCPKKADPTPPTPVEVEVQPPPPRPEVDRTNSEPATLRRVQFDYDSVSVAASSAEALRHNVTVLQERPGTRIEVQGHADERGTTEYNLGLAQRRAEAVKERMVRMGIAASRITSISYGEERPLRRGASEDVYSANRRAEFRVLSTGEGEAVEGTVR